MADTQNNITTVFSADISNFSKSTQDLNRYISTVNAEFKNATAGMDDWSKSTDGLEAKLKQLNGVLTAQKKKLADTQAEYDALKAAGKENTAEAQKLYIKLQNQNAEVKKTEKAIEDYSKALKDNSKETKAAEKSTSEFGKSLANLAKGALTAVVASVAGTVTAFLALAESTRELRTEMGKLETAYTTAGHSAETAEKTYKTLYGVLGDSGKATEAAQHLAVLANDEKELAQYTDILTGVYAKYGDSLPTEGLAEAMNHTAQLGAVQGNLADALEWSGVNVDDFNAQLSTCNTEQERQQLIASTLTSLYGEQAEKYKEVNADVIAANEAQANLNQSLADLGAIAEPINTILKNIGATILTGLLPYVQQLADVFATFFSGDFSGGMAGLQAFFDEVAPKVQSLLENVITTILTKIGEILPKALPLLVGLLSTIIQKVVGYIPTLLDAAGKLLIQIVKAIPPTISKLIQELPKIITSILSALTGAQGSLAQTAMSLFFEIIKAIPKIALDLIKNMPQIISAIVKGLASGYKEMFNIGKDMLKGLWEGMASLGDWIWGKIKGFFNNTLVGGIKKLLGIKSPSKVFAEIGEFSGEGYVEGFANTIKGAASTLNAGDYAAAVGVGSNGGGTVNNRTSNVTVYQTFEKMPTSRYALRQAKLEAVNALKFAGGI